MFVCTVTLNQAPPLDFLLQGVCIFNDSDRYDFLRIFFSKCVQYFPIKTRGYCYKSKQFHAFSLVSTNPLAVRPIINVSFFIVYFKKCFKFTKLAHKHPYVICKKR